MRRWIFVLALGLLPGCDVATAALLLSSSDSSSSDGDPLPAPPTGPGPLYQAWVAQIPAGGEDAARAALVNFGGDPLQVPSTPWRFIANAATTAIFDPNASVGAFNAILVQVSDERNYSLDCVEVLDVDDTPIEFASGMTYSNLVNSADDILGPADGQFAVTTATTPQAMAFIFTIYSGTIDRFRIGSLGQSQAPAPGDVLATGDYQSIASLTLNVRPGGLAIGPAGEVYITLSIGDEGWLTRYNLAGQMQDEVMFNNDLAAAGSHSVAVSSAVGTPGVIYTSASVGSGLIQVCRFDPIADITSASAIAPFASTFNGDRVEHNSIAVDGSGNVVVVGGFSSLLSGRNHWRVKIPATVTGAPLWQSQASLDGSNSTYWHAVTTGANDEVFMTGDLLSSILGGTNRIYSGRFDASGAGVSDAQFNEGNQPADMGHAIALDSSGNIYVGGSVGAAASNGRDAILLRYSPDWTSVTNSAFNGPASLDDEILDIAVDTDGSIYAVGYKSVPNQDKNWFVRKYTFAANTLGMAWERTYDGGNGVTGDDRAQSVAISGNNLVVAGFETNAAGLAKLMIRIYEK